MAEKAGEKTEAIKQPEAKQNTEIKVKEETAKLPKKETKEKPTETKKESPKEQKKEELPEKETAGKSPKENKNDKKEITAGKKETKTENKQKSGEKKPVIQKPKEKKRPKAVNKIKKTKEQKKLQEKIKQKKVPVIRGNFGKAWLRRKAIKKWQKWRKPRGIDFLLKKENGAKPLTGFRTPKEIRHLHPSGLEEKYIRNLNELKEVKRNVVIRLKGTLGKKARKEIIKTAKEMNLRILN